MDTERKTRKPVVLLDVSDETVEAIEKLFDNLCFIKETGIKLDDGISREFPVTVDLTGATLSQVAKLIVDSAIITNTNGIRNNPNACEIVDSWVADGATFNVASRVGIKKTTDPMKKADKVIAAMTIEQQKSWLREKAAAMGIEL